MEQTIDIRKLNEEVIALKLEVAKIKEDLEFVKEGEFSEEDDLEFSRRTEEAWKEIDEGKGVSMSKEEFLKEIKKW